MSIRYEIYRQGDLFSKFGLEVDVGSDLQGSLDTLKEAISVAEAFAKIWPDDEITIKKTETVWSSID